MSLRALDSRDLAVLRRAQRGSVAALLRARLTGGAPMPPRASAADRRADRGAREREARYRRADLACPPAGPPGSEALDVAAGSGPRSTRGGTDCSGRWPRSPRAFGWTEAEILALSETRRQVYLALARADDRVLNRLVARAAGQAARASGPAAVAVREPRAGSATWHSRRDPGAAGRAAESDGRPPPRPSADRPARTAPAAKRQRGPPPRRRGGDERRHAPAGRGAAAAPRPFARPAPAAGGSARRAAAPRAASRSASRRGARPGAPAARGCRRRSRRRASGDAGSRCSSPNRWLRARR